MRLALTLPVLLFGTVLLVAPASAADSGFDHSEWSQVLQRFVDEHGLVDYQRLASDRATFDRYVARIQEVSPDSHPQLFADRAHELAYWINAYNALVFYGVLDRGPETDSVWKGGLISGRKFFVSRDIVVGGNKTNLKKLEDDIVRERYRDPRIHAALNCASISCPRLPQQAFLASELEQQLDAAMTEFVNSEAHIEVDRPQQEIRVSKIFDWFGSDFLDFEERNGNQKPEIVDYINRYRPKNAQLPRDWDVSFISYDKGINQQ